MSSAAITYTTIRTRLMLLNQTYAPIPTIAASQPIPDGEERR